MTDTTLVPVPVGACRCPGAPHGDGDVVFLYPKLGFEAGISIMAAVDTAANPEEQLKAIYIKMVDHGVADWTFANGDGAKIPINAATIRGALTWMEGGSEVARAAIRTYQDVFLAPFKQPSAGKTSTATSSPTGPTASPSTSARRTGSPRRRARSAPSSSASSEASES